MLAKQMLLALRLELIFKYRHIHTKCPSLLEGLFWRHGGKNVRYIIVYLQATVDSLIANAVLVNCALSRGEALLVPLLLKSTLNPPSTAKQTSQLVNDVTALSFLLLFSVFTVYAGQVWNIVVVVRGKWCCGKKKQCLTRVTLED